MITGLGFFYLTGVVVDNDSNCGTGDPTSGVRGKSTTTRFYNATRSFATNFMSAARVYWHIAPAAFPGQVLSYIKVWVLPYWRSSLPISDPNCGSSFDGTVTWLWSSPETTTASENCWASCEVISLLQKIKALLKPMIFQAVADERIHRGSSFTFVRFHLWNQQRPLHL